MISDRKENYHNKKYFKIFQHFKFMQNFIRHTKKNYVIMLNKTIIVPTKNSSTIKLGMYYIS